MKSTRQPRKAPPAIQGAQEGTMPFPFGINDEYFNEPIRFKDCEDHYELVFTGEFEEVGEESIEVTRLMQDLKDGDKSKELHIFINSIGGDCELLSMILQQVLQYQHRVTVCCGAAMSAGFILWASGHERYVSPYSELMYHTIYSGYEGKGVELSAYGHHIERLTEHLMTAVNMQELIPEKDIQTGKSTEVWYLGEDFIHSRKAKDYSEYLLRQPPISVPVLLAGGKFFVKSVDGGYVQLVVDQSAHYPYTELVRMMTEEVLDDAKASGQESAVAGQPEAQSQKVPGVIAEQSPLPKQKNPRPRKKTKQKSS